MEDNKIYNRKLTEDKIRTAALELFSEKGFKATTIRMISEKSGCNKTLISRYFGSKKRLFRKIIEENFEIFIRRDVENTDVKNLSEALQFNLTASLKFIVDRRAILRIIIREAVSESWYKKIFEKYDPVYRDQLFTGFEKMKKKGILEKDLDIEKIISLITDFTDSLVFKYIVRGVEIPALEDDIDNFVDFISTEK